jgi:DNA-binding NarL/FixJ family response regulator
LPQAVRVLLADDDPGFLESLRACLPQPPIEIVGMAADGEDALAQVERLSPDVAVLDVLMPRLGGIEAANRCRGLRPDCRLILISGSIFSATPHDLASVADRFLTKSEAMRQLAPTILGLSGTPVSSD